MFARVSYVPTEGFALMRNMTPDRTFGVPEKTVYHRSIGWSFDEAGQLWVVRPVVASDGVEADFTAVAPLAERRDSPGLHREFAGLDATDAAAILDFANRWGLLGQGLRVLSTDSEADGTVYRGEPLTHWREKITDMATLLSLWDLVSDGSSSKGAPFVKWTKRPTRVHVGAVHLRGRLNASASRTVLDQYGQHGRWASACTAVPYDGSGFFWQTYGTPELLDRWQRGESTGPLRYYVHETVNKAMRGHVSPAVLPFENSRVHLFPDTLRAALYVLFALELEGFKLAPIPCAFCGKVFSPLTRRKTYCSDNCRKRSAEKKPKVGA